MEWKSDVSESIGTKQDLNFKRKNWQFAWKVPCFETKFSGFFGTDKSVHIWKKSSCLFLSGGRGRYDNFILRILLPYEYQQSLCIIVSLWTEKPLKRGRVRKLKAS